VALDEPLVVPSSVSTSSSSVDPSSSSTPHVPMGTIYDNKPPVTHFYARTWKASEPSSSNVSSPSDEPPSDVSSP
jgi:hypothetical protein